MSKARTVYLTAKYLAKPRKKHATATKGYMADPNNVQWDEEVKVVQNLKNRDLTDSKIILNINERKVIKNGFQTNQSFDTLFDYFYKNSSAELNQQLSNFGIKVERQDEQPISEDVPNKEEGTLSGATQAEPSVS